MIINVGARTDIVNYYSGWLINRIREEYVYVRNPLFQDNVSKVSLKQEDVDCLIMCSKNYRPILKYIDEINSKYRLICHYTITAFLKDVEPNVPSIDESIDTLIKLSKTIGKEKIIWRYDPLLLTKRYSVDYLINTFDSIAKKVSPYVNRCIFSFVEMYKKLEINMPEIIPFTDEDKIKLVKEIGYIATKYNLYVQTCGSDINYEEYGIHKSGCITKEILEQVNNVEYKKMKESHIRRGCHCVTSRDIGQYDTCLNGCKYCYANKRPYTAINNYKHHDKNSPILIGNIKKTDKITASQPTKLITNNYKQMTLI